MIPRATGRGDPAPDPSRRSIICEPLIGPPGAREVRSLGCLAYCPVPVCCTGRPDRPMLPCGADRAWPPRRGRRKSCACPRTRCAKVRQSKLAGASARAGAPVERLAHSRSEKRASRCSGELKRRAMESPSAPSTLMQKDASIPDRIMALGGAVHAHEQGRRLGRDRAHRCRNQSVTLAVQHRGDQRDPRGQTTHAVLEQPWVNHGDSARENRSADRRCRGGTSW